MKSILLTLLAIAILSSCDKYIETKVEIGDTKIMSTKTKSLRHVVLFRFNETATQAQIQEIETAFTALPSKIKAIQDFEWGLNNSPENLDKGFTHCFFVSFASEKDRAIYLPHPDHLAFVDILKPHLADVMVVDYWTSK